MNLRKCLDRSYRLEAATSRLEDMVPNMSDASTITNGVSPGQTQSLVTSKSVDSNRIASPSPSAPVETLPPAIDDFDALINSDVETFVNVSEEIGGLVAEQVGTST